MFLRPGVSGGETKIKMAHLLPIGEFTVFLGTCVLETQLREENTTPSSGGEWIREGSLSEHGHWSQGNVGSNLSSIIALLCDRGQMTSPLWASSYKMKHLCFLPCVVVGIAVKEKLCVRGCARVITLHLSATTSTTSGLKRHEQVRFSRSPA